MSAYVSNLSVPLLLATLVAVALDLAASLTDQAINLFDPTDRDDVP